MKQKRECVCDTPSSKSAAGPEKTLAWPSFAEAQGKRRNGRSEGPKQLCYNEGAVRGP